jgi:hypothetical protein
MDLRKYETPEPSHIHVARPSRAAAAQDRVSAVEELDESVLTDEEASQGCSVGDAD